MRRDWGERTAADIASLLVELSRLLKGVRFYPPEDPARRQLLERAGLAWQVELERGGPVVMAVATEGIQLEGIRERIDSSALQDLVDALRTRAVERLAISPGLSREGLSQLAELLVAERTEGWALDTFARRLYAGPHKGIEVNGLPDTEVSVEPIGPEELAAELGPKPAEETSPRASLGAALLRRRADESDDAECDAADSGEGEPESGAAGTPIPAAPDSLGTVGDRLLGRLRELDRCYDDAGYSALAGKIASWALRLFEEGDRDESHRAILVLTDHAAGGGGRSAVQARAAHSALTQLVTPDLREDVIARAGSPDPEAGVRAARVLLQLGEPVVPALLARIDGETDERRAHQLGGVVLALGEHAIAPLRLAMTQGSASMRRLAVRLGGQLQSPRLAAPIGSLMNSDEEALRTEAVRALVHIGGDPAVGLLDTAVDSETSGLSELALHALGALAPPRVVPGLLSRLEAATDTRRIGRARALLATLAHFPEESRRIVPKLVALLERRSVFHRREAHELKLAATGTLERMRGPEARRALERALRGRDVSVAKRAHQALARRASSEDTG